jgi:DNA-binding response OmpR family regulator
MAIYREPIEAVLKSNGYLVVTAANGADALVAISKRRPDLILLDLEMPHMGGMEVLKRIREGVTTADLPVVILSGETDRVRVADAILLGISGYISKSKFSLSELLDRIERAFRAMEQGRTTTLQLPAPSRRNSTAESASH